VAVSAAISRPRIAVPSAARSTRWTMQPHGALARASRVIRRLGGDERFLGADDISRTAIAKLPRAHLTKDVHVPRSPALRVRAFDELAHPSPRRRLDTVLMRRCPLLLFDHVPGPASRRANRLTAAPLAEAPLPV
jgi:hypothetical protein